jgi:protein-disulfide isomerase
VNNGNAIIVGATILGLSLIGGAYLLGQSIDGATTQIAAVGGTIAKLEFAADAPAPAPSEPARRRGPDVDRVYEIDVAGSPTKGPAGAQVTVVEFSDFQCPFCGRVTPTLDQVQETYGDDVRIVFKHLPLRIHPNAPKAHAAAEAAKGQGKFWEMHDLIFANQRELTEEKFIGYAQQLGLDVERFKKDLASSEVAKRVEADVAEAARLGVTGTPGFFINGKFFSGAKPFSEFKRMIDAELKKG